MASKHCIILLLIFVAVTIAEADNGYINHDPSNTFIQGLGSFSVNEHNKGARSHLNFIQVYGGYTITGERGWTLYNRPRNSFVMEFHLDLMATNCSQSEALGNYTAVVQMTNTGTLILWAWIPR